MIEILTHLFDPSGFPARWQCGRWSSELGWLHILSDLGVWSAYVAIPIVLGYFVYRKKEVPFRMIFWLFGAFILACGTTHLMEAIIFWWPAYRLSGVLKLFTAVVAWSTVIALVPFTPQALAMLAHELRNPLAPIRNALAVIELAGDHPDILDQSHQMAERQVQHMARLLDDILDASRISRGRIELRQQVVDLVPTIRRTVEAASPLIDEQQHRLTVSIVPGPLEITGDPTRLEQIVLNSLNNAAKYTEPGGHIELELRREGREVVLRIRDNGIGIPPEMLTRIFDLFVQVERRVRHSQGGVGIGLTLVRNLTEIARRDRRGPLRGPRKRQRIRRPPARSDGTAHGTPIDCEGARPLEPHRISPSCTGRRRQC
ncbi:MAG: sensor histidine kinase [Isosphaeraceae bacterium]